MSGYLRRQTPLTAAHHSSAYSQQNTSSQRQQGQAVQQQQQQQRLTPPSPQQQQQQQHFQAVQQPQYIELKPQHYQQPRMTYMYKDELDGAGGEQQQKIPLFLLKLWNIVEDPAYREVVCWDETGLSFHIMDPYAFCSNILPQYFKHKNLNSLVRQLNMYGFRKNTPLERTGLARAESDQDHLEFMHPFFRRDHPELIGNIRRKVPNKQQQQQQVQQVSSTTAAIQQQQMQQQQAALTAGDQQQVGALLATSTASAPVPLSGPSTKDLTGIFDELKALRDRQKGMEMRMEELTKENEMLWTEMAHVRGTHLKQQQIVNKLIQFLVALVGPNAGKQQGRLGKRHLSGRSVGQQQHQLQSILPPNATEILERLISDIGTSSTAGGGGDGPGGGDFLFNNSTLNDPAQRHVHHQFMDLIQQHADNNTDEFSLYQNASSNNQQLQPYTGPPVHQQLQQQQHGPNRSNSGVSLMSRSSSGGGPIIAEVTDELEQQQQQQMNMGGGGAALFQAVQAPMDGQQQQQQMAVIVTQPMTPLNLVDQQQPGQEGGSNSFRGFSNSFGGAMGGGGPPLAKRTAFQFDRKPIQMAPQQLPQRGTPTAPAIPSQPVVIYEPITPMQQQQQQSPQMVQQPMVHQQQPMLAMPRASPTTAPGGRQQQQAVLPVEQQQHVQQQFGGGGPQQQHPMDLPLTEGMLLTEQEMAEIANLNSYLDENGARFHSLTNTIGEHWDDVGSIGPPSGDEFQDWELGGANTSFDFEHGTAGGVQGVQQGVQGVQQGVQGVQQGVQGVQQGVQGVQQGVQGVQQGVQGVQQGVQGVQQGVQGVQQGVQGVQQGVQGVQQGVQGVQQGVRGVQQQQHQPEYQQLHPLDRNSFNSSGSGRK